MEKLSFIKIIKDFFKRFTVKNIAQVVGFILFSIITTFLSITMYLIIGKTPLDDIIMMTWGVATELFKIYAAIMLTSTIYIYNYWKKRAKKEKAPKLNFWDFPKQSKKYTILKKKYTSYRTSLLFNLGVYLICVFTSLYASLGYGLVTVNNYSEQGKIVNNADKIETAKLYIQEREGRIKEREELIVQKKKFLSDAMKGYDKIDPEAVDVIWQKSVIDKKIKTLNEDIGKYQTSIDTWNDDITKKRDEILALKDAETKDVTTKERSMFDLMSESLDIPATKLLFFLVALLVCICEIGIITLAPHQNSVDDDTDIKKLKQKQMPIPDGYVLMPNVPDQNLLKSNPEEKILPFPKEEKLLPAPEEKIQPIVEKKIQTIKEEKVQPVVEEKAIPIEQEKQQPEPEIKTPVEVKEPVKEVDTNNLVMEKRELNEDEKKEFIQRTTIILDEIKKGGDLEFSIKQISNNIHIDVLEIKKMFIYFYKCQLIDYNKGKNLWKFKLSKENILNYLKTKVIIY